MPIPHRGTGARSKASSASPRRRATASTFFGTPAGHGVRTALPDKWSESDPGLFDESVDRLPEQAKGGHSVVQCGRGASETGNSDIYTLFRTLLQLAEHRVRLATAYFVPDDEIVRRLSAAAQRGVMVELLLAGP